MTVWVLFAIANWALTAHVVEIGEFTTLQKCQAAATEFYVKKPGSDWVRAEQANAVCAPREKIGARQ